LVINIIETIQNRLSPRATPLAPSAKFKALYKKKIQNIVKNNPVESMNSLKLLDHEYFLIQYISKHIQQYNIKKEYLEMYIKFLSWIRDASLILSNRLKLPRINKDFVGDLVKRTYD
jgi:hypothetical protein